MATRKRQTAADFFTERALRNVPGSEIPASPEIQLQLVREAGVNDNGTPTKALQAGALHGTWDGTPYGDSSEARGHTTVRARVYVATDFAGSALTIPFAECKPGVSESKPAVGTLDWAQDGTIVRIFWPMTEGAEAPDKIKLVLA